ncbi:hypothetical protein V8G54_027487 [Vigna mungo]|uniref:Uncharacterized protein n=1 Tax=Vigna mungo TaxID=3915 RepID=A0AAQ3N1H4_VIGMU
MTKMGENSRDWKKKKKRKKKRLSNTLNDEGCTLTWPRESPEDNPKPPTLPFLPIIEGMFLAGIIIPAGIFQTLENSILSCVQCCVDLLRPFYVEKLHRLGFFLDSDKVTVDGDCRRQV